MDIIQLYQDYDVDFRTEGHKHSRSGWVNTSCPYCEGNPGYHLGFDTQSNYYYCWRCGWHPTIPTISTLIKVDEWEIKKWIGKYGLLVPNIIKDANVKVRMKAHKMPSNVGPLSKLHEKYLNSRDFDIDKIISTWSIIGTGPISTLDKIDYSYRIVAPIIWNNQEVSFQTRDITNKSKLKYKACPMDRELIHHKHILYGKQEKWKDTGVCVEGITDVWRFGPIAFATFGIKYTAKQLKVMSKSFKRIAVIFDDEPQAIIQAKILVADLKFRGIDAWHVKIKGDPGSMDQTEADYLIKQIVT